MQMIATEMTGLDPASVVAGMFRAATGAAPWEEVLASLAAALDSEHYTLLLRSTRRISVVEVLANSIPAAVWTEYEDRFGGIDPLAPRAAARPRGSVFTSDELLPFDRLRRTPYYNEWMGRNGMRRFLGSSCHLPESENFVAVAFQRPPGSEGFGDEQRALLGGLLPHLQSAMETWARFAPASTRVRDLEALLDAVGVGVALLGDEGRVRLTNRSFIDVVTRGDGVSISNDRLLTGTPGSFEPVAAAITRAVDRGLPTTLVVERPSGKRPYRLHVVPLCEGSWRGLEGRRGAVVRLHDPGQRATALAHLLQKRYGLTAAEAETTVRLASGASLAEIAESSSRSVGTARNLLKRAFAKTDTHRQAELVCLVQRIENETGA